MATITNKQITKIYIGNKKVYSLGAIVNYVVDSSDIRQEEREDGDNALSPTTFTPTKSGWTFLGWREDTTASSSILTSKIVEDTTITLYAVFKKAITVTYYNNSTSTSTTSKDQYYNNGHITDPTFSLSQASKSGWTARGWSTSNYGNAEITYGNGASFTRSSNVTLYGLYQQTITLSYNGNGNTGGSTASQTSTRYWAPAGAINPSFALSGSGFTKTSYSFIKWAQGSASGTQYEAGANVTLSANTTFYAIWMQTVTTFNYTGAAQSYTVPVTGIYKIECWGANGGASRHGYAGGKGGYGSGKANLTAGTVLSIVVGGQGAYPDGSAATYSEWGDSYDDGTRWGTEHESHGSKGGSSYITSGSTTYIKSTGGTGGTCYWDDNHGNIDNPSEGGYSGSNGSVTINSALTEQSKGTSSLSGNGRITITFIGSASSITVTTYSYSGSIQTFIVPVTGTYKIECWGANGGNASHGYYGGKAGYGTGTISLTAGTAISVQVGSTNGYPDGSAGSYTEAGDSYDDGSGGRWWATEHEHIGGSGGTSTVSIGGTVYIKATGGTGAACYWDDNHGNLDNPSEGGYNGTNGSATVSSSMSNRSTGLSNRTAVDGAIIFTRL